MEKINEEELLAILYSNFSGKGKQKNDWIFIADKLNELNSIYNSEEKIAKNLGLSREMVRSTIKLLELPEEVKQLIRSNKITQDLGWRLLAIKEKKTIIEVAKSIIGLSAHDARDMIRFAKNNPDIPIKNQIERLKQAKAKEGKLNIFITTLSDADYGKLQKIAKEKGLKANELIVELIRKI